MTIINTLLGNKLWKIEKLQIPFLVWFVILSTVIASSIGDLELFGYSVKGLGWFLQFIFSSLIFLRNPKRVCFPWYLWLPWICLVIVYLAFSEFPNALQRSFIMLCPIVVGMVISMFPIREANLGSFIQVIRYVTAFFLAIIIIKTGLVVTHALPMVTGLSPQVMTGSLLAVIFAVTFVYERKKDLLIWIGLALVPIVAMTRTAVIATGLTLPLTFAPLKLSKRLVLLVVIVVIGIGLFYTERFQRKMFYSGKGTIADLTLNNPDFFSSGRARLWELMNQEIMDKPLFGHGANAQEDFIFSYVGFYGQPHNDWLRLLFDYGYLGGSIFAFCVLLQIFHAWKRARNTIGGTRILFYAGASAFLPFILFMFTDNIILYVSFFSNLHFAILGLAYASLNTSMRDGAWYQYQTYLSSLVESNNSSKKVGTPYEFKPHRNSLRT